jgi:hypothetical protein
MLRYHAICGKNAQLRSISRKDCMSGSLDKETQALLDFREEFGALVRQEMTPHQERPNPVKLKYEQNMSRINFALWKKSVELALEQAKK